MVFVVMADEQIVDLTETEPIVIPHGPVTILSDHVPADIKSGDLPARRNQDRAIALPHIDEMELQLAVGLRAQAGGHK
jgi:hypothetical protein